MRETSVASEIPQPLLFFYLNIQVGLGRKTYVLVLSLLVR